LGSATLKMINAGLLLSQSILPDLYVFLQLRAVLLQLSASARLELNDAQGEYRQRQKDKPDQVLHHARHNQQEFFSCKLYKDSAINIHGKYSLLIFNVWIIRDRGKV